MCAAIGMWPWSMVDVSECCVCAQCSLWRWLFFQESDQNSILSGDICLCVCELQNYVNIIMVCRLPILGLLLAASSVVHCYVLVCVIK